MNTLRALLAVIAGCAFGIVVAEIILGLGPRDAGICIAVIAACVLLRYLIETVQEDQDLNRRLDRERVWARRDECGWPLCSYEPHECPEARRTA